MVFTTCYCTVTLESGIIQGGNALDGRRLLVGTKM